MTGIANVNIGLGGRIDVLAAGIRHRYILCHLKEMACLCLANDRGS
jgi:hypothetical protein